MGMEMIKFGISIMTYGSIVLLAYTLFEKFYGLTTDQAGMGFMTISLFILLSGTFFIIGGLFDRDKKWFLCQMAYALLLIGTVILMIILIIMVGFNVFNSLPG